MSAPSAEKKALNVNAKAFTPAPSAAPTQKPGTNAAAKPHTPSQVRSAKATPPHAPQQKMPMPVPMMMPGAPAFMPMAGPGGMPMHPGVMMPGQVPFPMPQPPMQPFMPYPMQGMGMAGVPMPMPMPNMMPAPPPSHVMGKVPPPVPGMMPYPFMPAPLPVQAPAAPNAGARATPPQTPPQAGASFTSVPATAAAAAYQVPAHPRPPLPVQAAPAAPVPVQATRAIPSIVSAPVPPPTAAPVVPPRVSVGNASLAALSSNEVPKFSCVLLSGLPAAGKSTMGRELVNSLQEDNRGWAFFSGADFLQEERAKRPVWETTKEVFDALSKRLDDLLEQQREHRNLRGLVIDKNCKGIEDIYYLSALLKSKNIPFVGIVGMEVEDENVLIQRMGGDEELREKLKYHRVTHARIVSLTKAVGMYRYVDASQSKGEVVQALRARVLGCVAQPPVRGIRTHHYDDSKCNSMVDDYREYADVLSHLFQRVSSARGYQFPAAADFAPFSTKEMSDKNRVNAYRTRYGARRDVEGMRFILMCHNGKLYLVPPHMRAVLEMSTKAWLGTKLPEVVGSFVLEGILTRQLKEKHKEMFLAHDALFWSDVEDPTTNAVMRMAWPNRQNFLASHLSSEEKAFYPPDVNCVVVHHITQHMDKAIDLLDPTDYESNGLVFQPTTATHRGDHALVWRQPSNMTVDFRVGALDKAATEEAAAASAAATQSPTKVAAGGLGAVAAGDAPVPTIEAPLRTYALEVYDKMEKRYVQFNGATVSLRHPDVVEGCIVSCSIKNEAKSVWLFHRLRYDVLRPIYKHELEHLLETCLVPRVKLVSWLIAEDLVNTEIQKDSTSARSGQPRRAVAAGATGASSVPAPSYASVAAGNAAGHVAPPPSYNVATASTGTIVGASTTTSPSGAAARNISDEQLKLMLANIVGTVHVVKAESVATAAKPSFAAALAASPSLPAAHAATDGVAPAEVPTSCAQCKRKKAPEDLRFDKREKEFYCYACWLKSGFGFCAVCGEFHEGKKEVRGRHKGSFVCHGCSNKLTAAATRDGGARSGADAGERRGAAKDKRRDPAKKTSEGKPVRSDDDHAEKRGKAREPKAQRDPKERKPDERDATVAETKKKEKTKKTSLKPQATADDKAPEAPKAETPKAQVPKTQSPKADAPKTEAPKAETPKTEAPKAEAPKAEAPKAETPKTEAPKAEAPKAEAPKAEAPKPEVSETDAKPAKQAEPVADATPAAGGDAADKKGGCTQS